MADSVTEYPAKGAGNVVPCATMSGSSTQLDAPSNIALDGSGMIYITNLNSNAVTEYPAGATALVGLAIRKILPHKA